MSKADELRLLREAIKSFPGALAVRDADGRLVACSSLYAEAAAGTRTIRALESGGTVELVADLAELHRVERENRLLAFQDAVTGLPNRRLLDDRLRQAIRLAQRRDRMVATLLVRLEDGTQVSDALLREVAERLSGCVRKADTVARSGVHEFALVVCDLKDGGDCRIVAEKVLQALAPEFRVAGRRLRLAVSVGVSLYPADGGDGEVLLRNADAASDRARQLGRNQIRFFRA